MVLSGNHNASSPPEDLDSARRAHEELEMTGNPGHVGKRAELSPHFPQPANSKILGVGGTANPSREDAFVTGSLSGTSTYSQVPGRIYLSPPHMSGREQLYVSEAFASNWITSAGPQLEMFEERLAATAGTRYAVGLSSGTAAIHLSLRALDLQPDDEVFCATFTFAASANPIRYEGALPVFLDCDPATWNLCPNLLQDELKRCARSGKLPRAVIAVDLYGRPAAWEELTAICGHYEIPLIADAAEALGATYRGRPLGGFGWSNVFSFNGNKIITTSGGGMLLTDDETLAGNARNWSQQSRDPAPHYEHSRLGFNYRLSNLLAAVGLGQLEVLSDRVAARRAIAARYRLALEGVPGIRFLPEPSEPETVCTHWLTCIRIDPTRFGATREEVRQHLESLRIESRPTWKPMHLQPVFRHCRSVGGAHAAAVFADGLCLPSGSNLTPFDQDRVIAAVRETPQNRSVP